MNKTMVELFAGVGGFRLGFDRLHSGWKTVWFSQWEPKKTKQWAYDCYKMHYGLCKDLDGNTARTGMDICEMPKDKIPDHTLLVAGFPCQDYSVAHTLSTAEGIQGKKGVLWWQIRDTIRAKKPPFCIFENVDRLLKSPAKQRGRDFGVILACLNELGYSAEWRVVNASIYGAAQRRRRTFIFAYSNYSEYGEKMLTYSVKEIIESKGFMVRAFPIESVGAFDEIELQDDLVEVSDRFVFDFKNSGYMREGKIYTTCVKERMEPPILLGDILQSNVDEHYYITNDKLAKWTYLKGAKKIPRKSANGHEYVFSEGPIAFPDPWDKPGRTMLTSESTLNRSTHIVSDPGTGKLRILTPIEAERLQGFDDNWTHSDMPERMRYFCMGNALVVPMVTRMGEVLDEIIEEKGPISSKVLGSFTTVEIPFLGCDFDKVYPKLAQIIPKEKVVFTEFSLDKIILCEIISAAICHQMNWDFLRNAMLEKIKADCNWVEPSRLAMMSSREVEDMLKAYPKKERIQGEIRARLLNNVGIWLLGYKRPEDVFLDKAGNLLEEKTVRINLLHCNAFSEDPEEKKMQLLLQKLSVIDKLEGLSNYYQPAIDYHLIRCYLRRGLLKPRNRYALAYVKQPDKPRKEGTIASIRQLCSDVLKEISKHVALDVVTVNLIEWNIGRSVCVQDEPDCFLKNESAAWLRKSFDKCPFYKTCEARCYNNELLTMNEPTYKGTSY